MEEAAPLRLHRLLYYSDGSLYRKLSYEPYWRDQKDVLVRLPLANAFAITSPCSFCKFVLLLCFCKYNTAEWSETLSWPPLTTFYDSIPSQIGHIARNLSAPSSSHPNFLPPSIPSLSASRTLFPAFPLLPFALIQRYMYDLIFAGIATLLKTKHTKNIVFLKECHPSTNEIPRFSNLARNNQWLPSLFFLDCVRCPAPSHRILAIPTDGLRPHGRPVFLN